MMLRSENIVAYLRSQISGTAAEDPLVITPLPDLDVLNERGSASVDLRLGCWFCNLKKEGIACLDVASPSHPGDSRIITSNEPTGLCEESYVNFGSDYILHPRSFVLAATLEWVRIPKFLGAYIHGKSSWGRRGLIVATASVIHPGFTGCITLELTNLGEVPIRINPGMHIAQLCLHHTQAEGSQIDQSDFNGRRKPTLGQAKIDNFALSLQAKLREKDHSYE